MRKILGMLLIVLSGAAWGQAQDAWWHSVASNVAKNDGSVTLTDANGNPVNVVANPTAAVVKPNQAAVTQPPTVIVQATTGYWKDPVASWASLPTTGNSVGDTRMVTGLGFAFTWNGTTWTPLAADQNGNMTAKTFIPTLIATAGQPCSNPGQSASSGSGPLFCQSGVWTQLRSSTQWAMDSYSPGAPSSSCNQAFSVPWPPNTTTVFLNASGSCNQLAGLTCELLIGGNPVAFSGVSSGRGSVSAGWTTSTALAGTNPLSVLVQAYDGSGNPVCDQTYGRVDAIFFY